MTLPVSGEISMSDIRTELSMSGAVSMSQFEAEINLCSPARPDGSPPYSMSEWYSYNHNAVPAAPSFTVYMTGSSISPANHDTQLNIKLTGGLPSCAATAKIFFSSTVGGTYTLLASAITDEYVHTGRSPDTSYYYKMSVADIDGTRESALTGPVQGRTGPSAPLDLQATFGSGTSNNYLVTLTWNNGTSPGERDMDPFIYRRRINFGSWTSWATASVGVTKQTYSDSVIGEGLQNFDQIDYELAYEPEDESTNYAFATHYVTLPD